MSEKKKTKSEKKQIRHQRLRDLASQLDFRCPHCGESLNEEFINFYGQLRVLIAKDAWANDDGSHREAARRALVKARAIQKSMGYPPHPVTEAERVLRVAHGKRMGALMVERRKELSATAGNDINASRQLRKPVLIRIQNKLRMKYALMKPILSQVTGGCVVTATHKQKFMEVADEQALNEFLASSKLLKDKEMYKVAMEDNEVLFGVIMFRVPSTGKNTAAFYVYGLPIPDSIPDLPDTLMKFRPMQQSVDDGGGAQKLSFAAAVCCP